MRGLGEYQTSSQQMQLCGGALLGGERKRPLEEVIKGMLDGISDPAQHLQDRLASCNRLRACPRLGSC